MYRFDNTQQELSKAAAQNKELQREMDRLQSETTRLKTQQLKAMKDSEKYKEERDSVISEYRLIMSERDQVIKEVDRLQTGLELAEAKLKNTSSERRVANEELEALRQVKNIIRLNVKGALSHNLLHMWADCKVTRKNYTFHVTLGCLKKPVDHLFKLFIAAALWISLWRALVRFSTAVEVLLYVRSWVPRSRVSLFTLLTENSSS